MSHRLQIIKRKPIADLPVACIKSSNNNNNTINENDDSSSSDKYHKRKSTKYENVDSLSSSDKSSSSSSGSSSNSSSDNDTANINAEIVSTTAPAQPQSSTDSIFKLMNEDYETYIFGDIEGHEGLFQSTISTIDKTKENNKVNYVFLGDLYDYDKPTDTIAIIEKIMNSLNITINQVFTDESKEIDVIRSFRKLWKTKQMKCYSKFNIQYIHSKLKPETVNNSKYLFILGNKEIIFVQEIITSEHITKTEDNIFNVPADYKHKHKTAGEPNIKHTDYKFSAHQLNIMHSFISICNNYAIINDILFIHCYINYKSFNDDVKKKVKHVISGHSKGYGHFIDTEFKGVDIYIIDLTKQENNDVNNYMIITKSSINYSFNSIIKPKLEKLEIVE